MARLIVNQTSSNRREIPLARGKRQYDKRETERHKTAEREAQQAVRIRVDVRERGPHGPMGPDVANQGAGVDLTG